MIFAILGAILVVGAIVLVNTMLMSLILAYIVLGVLGLGTLIALLSIPKSLIVLIRGPIRSRGIISLVIALAALGGTAFFCTTFLQGILAIIQG